MAKYRLICALISSFNSFSAVIYYLNNQNILNIDTICQLIVFENLKH